MNKYIEHSKASEAWQQTRKRIHSKHTLVCSKKRAHRSKQACIEWLSKNGYTGTPYQCPHCLLYHATTGDKSNTQ